MHLVRATHTMRLEMKAKARARKKSLSPNQARVIDGAGSGGGEEIGLSMSNMSDVSSNWEEAYDSEDDEEPEEIDTLEAQKVLQRDLVSHRSVIMEVALVLGLFVGLGFWATKTH